jgi:hypothetical protein
MKTYCLLIAFALAAASASGQQGVRKGPAKKSPAVRTQKGARSEPSVRLLSIANHNAYADSLAGLRIADPVLLRFNDRATGREPEASGIPGVPRGTYGFANGRLLLYPSGAVSTGTATGSGAVGTGTSPGAIGAEGPSMGVNGKSPFAGHGPFGIRVPLPLRPLTDSLQRARRQ